MNRKDIQYVNWYTLVQAQCCHVTLGPKTSDDLGIIWFLNCFATIIKRIQTLAKSFIRLNSARIKMIEANIL